MRIAAPPAPPIPALPAHQLMVFLLQAGLVVLLAVACGRLAARVGMPAVAGELCVGILLGPTVLGNAAPAVASRLLPQDAGQFHLIDAVGQIGVVLLVGITGVEMDLGLVRRRGGTALGVGLGGLVLPFGLGYAAGRAAPASLLPAGCDRGVFALFVAVALSVSALPVIAKILTDMDLVHRDVGQLTLAAGMVDDVVGWILLSVVSAAAVGGAGGDGLVEPLLATALVLAVTFVVLRPLVNRVMRAAEHQADTALVVGTATAFVLLASAATQALGLEAMFGAFLAGMLISTGPRSLLARLAPLRTVVLAVLAPLFFATAGLRLQLNALADPLTLAAGAALLLVAVVGKVAGVYAGARTVGVPPRESLALGGTLNARGVIQLVVAAAGLRMGVLNAALLHPDRPSGHHNLPDGTPNPPPNHAPHRPHDGGRPPQAPPRGSRLKTRRPDTGRPRLRNARGRQGPYRAAVRHQLPAPPARRRRCINSLPAFPPRGLSFLCTALLPRKVCAT